MVRVVDSPPLSDDARAAMRAARQAAADAGWERADGLQVLGATLDYREVTDLLALFSVDPGKLREGATFFATHGGTAIEPDSESRIVDLAREEAGTLGHQETGPAHLVLGIARQPSS